MATPNRDTFSPEMIRLLKIFGIGSLMIVSVMSFFNEKRSMNVSEVETEMAITDADRIYFKNLRGAYYDQEVKNDAKMTIYRLGKRVQEADHPLLNFSILLNRIKNEAYIYVEPTPEDLPIRLRWTTAANDKSGEISFDGGDKFAHLDFVNSIYPLLLENAHFERQTNGNWAVVLLEEKERGALLTTIKDYYTLIGKPL